MKLSKRIHNREEVNERLMFIREARRGSNVDATIKQNSKRATRKHLNSLPNNLRSLAIEVTAIKNALKSYSPRLVLQGAYLLWVNIYKNLERVSKNVYPFLRQSSCTQVTPELGRFALHILLLLSA